MHLHKFPAPAVDVCGARKRASNKRQSHCTAALNAEAVQGGHATGHDTPGDFVVSRQACDAVAAAPQQVKHDFTLPDENTMCGAMNPNGDDRAEGTGENLLLRMCTHETCCFIRRQSTFTAVICLSFVSQLWGITVTSSTWWCKCEDTR